MPNTKPRLAIYLPALSILLSISFAAPSLADSSTRQLSEFASGSGNILYLAAAVGLPFLRDGKKSKLNGYRALDSVGTASLISEGLKVLVREKRPDSNSLDSFPSGHATAAFAAATFESADHPREAWYWYTGATAISLSRIRLNRHYPKDVIAGAALGFLTTRLELSTRDGLLLEPIIEPEQKRIGLTISKAF